MPYEFRCTHCRGSFVGTQPAPAPKCPTMAGRVESVGAIPPERAAACTGCALDDDGMREALRGLSEATLTIRHFVPSTARGKFDCSLSTTQGTLSIRVALKTNWGWFSAFPAREQQEIMDAFRGAVPRFWNDRVQFRCTRPGWTAIVVRPRFSVMFDAPLGNHFSLQVSRPAAGPRDAPQMRDCRGFVSMRQVVDGNDVTDSVALRDYHVYDFDHTLGASMLAGHERERMERLLAAGGLAAPVVGSQAPRGRVVFPPGTDAVPAEARRLLEEFAQGVRERLPGTLDVPIVLQGIAATTEADGAALAARRLAAVKLILTGARVGATLRDGAPAATVTGAEGLVTLVIDRGFEGGDLGGQLAYNTAAHEFGHMIGLPDEYEAAVGGEGADAMAQAKAHVRRNFEALVERARLRPPTFPSHTSSMMSDGMTIQPWHMVTAWEALCDLTRPFLKREEWSIEPT